MLFLYIGRWEMCESVCVFCESVSFVIKIVIVTVIMIKSSLFIWKGFIFARLFNHRTFFVCLFV